MTETFKAVRISEHVHWVGAIDWSLREFHGYATHRGTTYNAYLIVADGVTLVDTVKAPFRDEMLARVASVVDPETIDVIISNHSVKGVRAVARIRELTADLKLTVKNQLVVINSAPPMLDPLVTDELSKLGTDAVATIPLDEEVYEYDLKLKPLLDLPDTSKAVGAVNDFMTEFFKN